MTSSEEGEMGYVPIPPACVNRRYVLSRKQERRQDWLALIGAIVALFLPAIIFMGLW